MHTYTDAHAFNIGSYRDQVQSFNKGIIIYPKNIEFH